MTAETPKDIWPLPKFYFLVKFVSLNYAIPFQEVSGLDSESEVIEYRNQNSPVFSTVKMPGIAKFSNITLKKGVFQKENEFWEWYNTIKMNTIKRETVLIQLVDESGNPTMTWTLANAWPTKISGTDLNSVGEEIAVELMELSHEGLTISNA